MPAAGKGAMDQRALRGRGSSTERTDQQEKEDKVNTLFSSLALGLAAPLATAQSVAVPVDGSACTGTGAVLDAGTAASGLLAFAYDANTAVLTVTVTNTSPVTVGVPNPLIDDIFFSAPAGTVTSAALTGQASNGGGQQPFDLSFDDDTASGRNPNLGGCFGLFNFELAVTTRRGGIANAAADTVATPSGTAVNGPAQFTLQLAGPAVHGLSAAAFAAATSHGGQHDVNAALHFVAGGKTSESGTVGSANACRTGVFLRGTPQLGQSIRICIEGSGECHATLLASAFAGPVVFSGITVPIGLPLIGWFDLGDFANGITELSLPVTIPNRPELVGQTFYLCNMMYYWNLTHPWGAADLFAFSPTFALTVF
jgi:hypothetical protein